MTDCELSAIEQPVCEPAHPARKFNIHIGPDLMRSLSGEAWMAFKRVPRRGLEIGGILLGRKDSDGDTTTFWIEGFQPVESEHRSGPSYVLSDSDFALLDTALTKNCEAGIGIYRSHTRSGPPAPGVPDIQLLERCFHTADALFLMLGSVPAVARFFVRTDRNMTGVSELALASALSSLMAPPVYPSPQRKPPADLPPETERNAPGAVDEHVGVPATRRFSGVARLSLDPRKPLPDWLPALKTKFRPPTNRGDWALAIAIAALAVAATVGVASNFHRPPMAAERRPPQYLPLTVQRAGNSLRLLWDQNTPVIRGAARAVLHIEDGPYHNDRDLFPSQLSVGSFTYQPKNAEQTFRLDVYPVEPDGTGVVQVINTSPAPIAPPQSKEPASKPALPAAPARTERPPVLPAEKAGAKPVEKKDIDLAAPPADEARSMPDELKPTPRAPENAFAPAPVFIPKPALVSTPLRGISVKTSMEPVSGSRLGHLAGQIPLVHRLVKPHKTVAPVALYQPQPQVRVPDEQLPIRPVSIDVKVDVAESGAVQHAEVVEFGNPPNWALVDAALAAAQRWTFQPARVEGTAVASKVILHFRFTP